MLFCQLGSAAAHVEANPPPVGTPPFTVLIATGTVVPGTVAILIALLEYGPVIQGPEIKNPKASLKFEHV